ncbi:MAG: hypothetical protein NTU88_09700, partial [Armatimonadetes bacterium]|nr:hypothetical protein [Armatimonadota bacterium]
VLVDNCAAYGVLITNGEFVSFYGDRPTQIVIGPENSGAVQFNNCAFWGPSYQCARVEGKGYVSFQQCHFLEWDSRAGAAPGIEVYSGMVNIQGCRFAKAAQSVHLRKAVRGGAITGNLFAMQNAVQLDEGATATIEANAVEAALTEPIAGSKVISVLGPHVRLEGEWWDYAGRGTYIGVAYFSVRQPFRPGRPSGLHLSVAKAVQYTAYTTPAATCKWR